MMAEGKLKAKNIHFIFQAPFKESHRYLEDNQHKREDGTPNSSTAKKGLLLQNFHTNCELLPNHPIHCANIIRKLPIKRFFIY
jgi:hypothetical protein